MNYWKFIGAAFLGLLLFVSSCSKKAHVEKLSKKESKEEKGKISETFFTEGMKLYILGNYNEAHQYFLKAYQITPDNAGLNFMMGKTSFILRNFQQALEYSTRALKLDSKNKYNYLLLAQVHEKMANYDEAIKVYKKLLAEIPGSEEYYYDLAAIYVFIQKYDEAISIYNKIENIHGISPELTHQKQQIYLRTNKLDQAIAEGYKLIETNPHEVDYKIIQAELLYSNERKEEAAKLVNKILEENPENGQAQLLLYEILSSQGKNKEAYQQLLLAFQNPEVDLDSKLRTLQQLLREAIEEDQKNEIFKLTETAIKTHPGESKLITLAGDIYFTFQKREEAWHKYLEAATLNSENFNLWVQIISLDWEMNKPDSMIVHCEKALESFPNQAVLWLYSGTAYLIKKDYEKAIEMLEEGKKLAGNNQELRTQITIQLGDCYNGIKDYKKSDAAFEEVLRVDPNNAHVLNNYSYFLSLRKEKLERAKEMSEKLIKKYPDDATYLDTYGWVLYIMGDYVNAHRYLEKAAKDSDNGTILEHYGDVLYKLNKTESALEQWKKAKEKGDTSEFIDKKIADKKLYE